MPNTAQELVGLLESVRFDISSESRFQDGVQRVLSEKGIAFKREVSLSGKDRVDFMVDDIAIELKVEGGVNAILRQLQRYAQSPQVKQIILLTCRTKHSSITRILSGKPVHVALFQLGLL
jgi:hypothetical protein